MFGYVVGAYNACCGACSVEICLAANTLHDCFGKRQQLFDGCDTKATRPIASTDLYLPLLFHRSLDGLRYDTIL